MRGTDQRKRARWWFVTVMSIAAAACGRSGSGAGSDPGTYTFALVYCGAEAWIGNDENPKIAADDPSRFTGTMPALRKALEQADLADSDPKRLPLRFDLQPL